MQFSEILKEERKKKNLTQFELAEMLNVSDKTISSWENGRSYPDITFINSICRILDVTPNVLLDAEDIVSDTDTLSKDEIKENGEKEKKFIKNSILAIALTFITILLPIITSILSYSFRTGNNSGIIGSIPNYSDYLKAYNTVNIVLLVLSIIVIITSAVLIIINSKQFKKDVLSKKNSSRTKEKYCKYINLYFGSLIFNIYLLFISEINNVTIACLLGFLGILSYIALTIILYIRYRMKLVINIISFISIIVSVFMTILFILLFTSGITSIFLFISIVLVYFSIVLCCQQKKSVY